MTITRELANFIAQTVRNKLTNQDNLTNTVEDNNCKEIRELSEFQVREGNMPYEDDDLYYL